jgi:chromosome segregation ATPase
MIIAFLIWAIVATVVALYLYDLTVRRYKVAKVKVESLQEESKKRTFSLKSQLKEAQERIEQLNRDLEASENSFTYWKAVAEKRMDIISGFENDVLELKKLANEYQSDTEMLRHLYKSTRIALDNRNKQLAHAESWKTRYRKQIQQLKDQKP